MEGLALNGHFNRDDDKNQWISMEAAYFQTNPGMPINVNRSMNTVSECGINVE